MDERILNEIYSGWLETLEWVEVDSTVNGRECYFRAVPYRVDEESEDRMRTAIRQWCDALPPDFNVECCVLSRPANYSDIGNRLYLTVQEYIDAFADDDYGFGMFAQVYSSAAKKMRRFEIQIEQQDDGTYVVYAE